MQPGPRDWLPSSCAAGGRRTIALPAPRPNHALNAAGLSAFFGLVALVMADAPLIPGAASFHTIIGAVGVAAVLWGVRATRRRDGRRGSAISVLTGIGVGTGAGTALVMLALLLAPRMMIA